MNYSTTIKANPNTIKVLSKMVSDKEAHRKSIVASIKEELKKQKMYKYSKKQGSNDPFFYFETENNLTYYVAFRNISQELYPLNNLYSLDFGEIDNKRFKGDSQISNTILEIILKFISNDNSRVIHYLCDNTDSKNLNRKRLFSRWFALNETENWMKYDYDFDSIEYNISFIYNSEIYDTDKMQEEILLTLDIYERAKDEI